MKIKLGVHEKILISFVILAFLLRIILINQNISVLISKFLADDAYYAYALAKNIINGHGIVFNYGIPTNGFHPFYNLAILAPIFKIFYHFGQNLPIYASLYTLSIFSVATGVFIYAIVNKLLNKTAGLFAAFIWLFNPYVLFTSLMGLEVAVQVFFISLLTYLMLKWKDVTRLSLGKLIVIGILIGLIFLSRMDGVFIGIGILLAMLFRTISVKRKIDSALIKNVFIITFVAALVVLPWLTWSFVRLGRITPISGEANHIQNFLKLGTNYVSLVSHSVISFMGFVVKFFVYPIDSMVLGAAVILITLVVPLIILLYKKDFFIFKTVSSLDFLIIGSILYYAFYFFYQLAVGGWYGMYTFFLTTVLFSVLFIRVVKLFEHEKVITTVIVFLLAGSFIYGGILHYQRGNYPFQVLDYEAIDYINKNIPADQKIGSFNTGILQYYSENHDIINLDGVMNQESLQAFKNHSIDNYILKKNITYIIDEPGYVKTFRKINSPLFQLEEIKTFKLNWYSYKNGEGNSILSLYKVLPSN